MKSRTPSSTILDQVNDKVPDLKRRETVDREGLEAIKTFCRGKVCFAVKKYVLPWKSKLSCEKVSFAVEK